MSLRTFIGAACASLVLLAVTLSGCSRERAARSGALIGPEGGQIALPDDGALRGARIIVPPGAVDEQVQFTIASGGVADGLGGARAVGPMVTFGPAGVAFALPVHISLPAEREPMVVWTREHGTTTWTRVEGAIYDSETGLVTADVMHFSDFVPLVMDAEADGGTRIDPDAGDFCTTHPRDPACVPTTPVLPGCDPIAQDCGATEMCIVADQEGGYDYGDGRDARCIGAGTVAAGGACTAPTDCARGTQCVFQTMFDSGEGPMGLTWFSQEETYLPMWDSVCLPICAFASSACPTASDLCNPVQLAGFSGRDVNEVYGVCAPPPPATPPR